MERDLATIEFEAVMTKLAEIDKKAEAARRKRDREYVAVLAVPFAFVVAACMFLNSHYAVQDRINQESVFVQEAKL